MNLFVVCVLYSLIPFLHADPIPDTIQIQNYDGPIFLHSPKPNCCPLCNSLLTQQQAVLEPENPCESGIPEEYHRTTPYGINDGTFAKTPNAYPITSGNQFGTPGNAYGGTVSGNANPGTLFHTNAGKPGITYPVSLTTNTYAGTAGFPYPGLNCPGSAESECRGSPCENTFNTGLGTTCSPFCGTTQPTITGTECTCTCVTKPLSSYLPINTSRNTCSLPTSSQNTCYNVPIVKNQVFGEEETVLVPQKFSYSLVLDGEIAPNFNQNGQCDYRGYYYC